MTNEEIVKALRTCVMDPDDGGDCENCPASRSEGEYCLTAVMSEAASLIEQLRREIEWKDSVIDCAQKKRAEATAERDALLEKLPQWISVEDRHPKTGTRVLATDGVFVGEAYRTSADTWRRYDGIAMRDCIGSVVTHWMPLPEAPKFADVLRGAPEVPEGGEKA